MVATGDGHRAVYSFTFYFNKTTNHKVAEDTKITQYVSLPVWNVTSCTECYDDARGAYMMTRTL